MKLSYLYTLTAIAGSILLFPSCKLKCVKGSGKTGTETRKLAAFKKLDVSGGFKITLVQDSMLSAEISADDNLLKYIKTDVSGDELHISTGKKSLCTDTPMEIVLHVKNLASIDASGAVEVKTNGKLVTRDLEFDLSGATKINMEVNAANVRTGASGATEINLTGQASSHAIEISGTGKVHAFNFIVSSYSINTTGASECEINVLKDLSVESTGASNIKYKGNPENVKNHETGASSVTKVE